MDRTRLKRRCRATGCRRGRSFAIGVGAASSSSPPSPRTCSARRSLATIVFYGFYYTLWLAANGAQHRDRRRGRAMGPVIAWAAAERHDRAPARAHVPRHLPLDAAPLLGARALLAGRLPEDGHPDAAGGQRGGGDLPSDRALHVRPGRAHARHAVPEFGGRDLRRRGAPLGRSVRVEVVDRQAGHDHPFGVAGVGYSIVYLFVLFVAISSMPWHIRCTPRAPP
jgi:hypothetical protein